jgi:CxxC motif-containing protein (DUF1111 family)
MRKHIVAPAVAAGLLAGLAAVLDAQPFRATDPGVRGDPAGAGGPLPGLDDLRLTLFEAGREDFREQETVADGLGPRFNLQGCAGCHRQPATGGTSGPQNFQANVPATFTGNRLPSFIRADGPVREVRFKYHPDGARDGGVHNLFVITGGPGAGGCTIRQENFDAQRDNIIFRIPTPVFGAGLIEQIPDRAILANQAAAAGEKAALGIRGRPNRIRIAGAPGGRGIWGEPNRSDNDGTIARFGWKAQNKSLLLFSGEAYNVEMGISNELFPTERDETPGCQFAPTPNDVTGAEANGGGFADLLSGVEKFAFFMRFLAPPTPSPDTPGGGESIGRGRQLFGAVGCALCHTPALRTGDAAVAQLANREVNLYSDLLLHRMGPRLADDIVQGEAGGDEFRTAPLWGLGQRIFFLHDGRTRDLVEAIQSHRSGPDRRFPASEANGVVDRYNRLSEREKQDVLNFLRSL